ncbi:class IIb bacteriocin, lactobin A/cerein 7B family [Shewanella sp. MBTL60-007]|nr:class IIb bacteriocin, lactobin A/cerein 7B family [Shewanella sp. MBTL60-007]
MKELTKKEIQEVNGGGLGLAIAVLALLAGCLA